MLKEHMANLKSFRRRLQYHMFDQTGKGIMSWDHSQGMGKNHLQHETSGVLFPYLESLILQNF